VANPVVLGHPVVRTKHFSVQGTSLQLNSTTPTLSGNGSISVAADVFYGIPFAKPPVGPLRFELH